MGDAVLDPIHVCELLSGLVPLVAERAAFDAIETDGGRRRIATYDQRRGASTGDGGPPSRPMSGRTVHVRVDDTTVGELVVWCQGTLGVVEEALVVLTAERISDEIEIAALRSRGAAAFADGVGLDLRGPLQSIGFTLELLRSRVRNDDKELARDWLDQRIDGLERAVERLFTVADRISEVSHPAAERRNAGMTHDEHRTPQ